jgi:hypothetical protein
MCCYCSICRKTNGSGGYGINLGGDYQSLDIQGEENISIYRATLVSEDGTRRTSSCERRFCRICGSGLWVYSPDWPDLVHPFASAIDTDLPDAPAHSHLMMASKAAWVPVEAGPEDRRFERYPDESLADWHQSMGFEDV